MDEKVPTIIECIEPGGVFSEYFGNDLSSWAGHIAILKSIYGLELSPSELEFWQTYTKRQQPNPEGYEDIVIAAGRRSGKTFLSSLLCCYEILFGGFDSQLKPGERAFGFILASTKRQATEGLRYCKALLRSFEKIVGMKIIESERSDGLDLVNGINLDILPVINANIRGRAVAFAACDEVAFWKDEEAANPASDVMLALYPSKMPGARLIQISSCWSKWGWFWDMYQQHYVDKDKENDPVLFVKAATHVLNPEHKISIRQKMAQLFKGRKEDTNLEWEAEFREVTEGFLTYDLIVAHMKRPKITMPDSRFRYQAFIDSAGGATSTGDCYTIAIGHHEPDGRVMVDYVEETKPPFDVVEVTKRYAETARRFGCWHVTSDNFASEFLTVCWRDHGRMGIVKSALSASELYQEFQQRLQAGLVEMCADDVLKFQLQTLRVVNEPGGRVRVEHPAYGNLHDDLANAVAGCVFITATSFVSVKELDARLPTKGPHQSERYMTPSMVAFRKREEVLRSAEEEMDEWAKENKLNKIIRR